MLGVPAGSAAIHFVDFGEGVQQVGDPHTGGGAANGEWRALPSRKNVGVTSTVVQVELIIGKPLTDAVGADRVDRGSELADFGHHQLELCGAQFDEPAAFLGAFHDGGEWQLGDRSLTKR